MQVEGQHRYLYLMATGIRVRNAYTIYLIQEDSPKKFGLILHNIHLLHDRWIKDLFRYKMSMRPIS